VAQGKGEFILACRAFLARFRGKLSGTFQNQVIVLDNRPIVNAKLIDCELWYGGGNIHMNRVNASGCSFHVFGAAARTVRYMQSLDKMAPDVIGKTFPGAILDDRKQFSS
jgi:hypothetical protein